MSSMLYVFDGVWPVQVGPLLHRSALLNPAHGDVRHLPSLLTITCNFVSLLTVSSAHTKTKKTKSVNLCSAQLSSAELRRAHGQKTNKKTGPWYHLRPNIHNFPKPGNLLKNQTFPVEEFHLKDERGIGRYLGRRALLAICILRFAC